MNLSVVEIDFLIKLLREYIDALLDKETDWWDDLMVAISLIKDFQDLRKKKVPNES